LPYQVIESALPCIYYTRPISPAHVGIFKRAVRRPCRGYWSFFTRDLNHVPFFLLFCFVVNRCTSRRSSGRLTRLRRLQISFFDPFRMDGFRQFIFWHPDRSGTAVRSRSRIRPNAFTGEITVTIPPTLTHTHNIPLTSS
jgi:hypothetical protein